METFNLYIDRKCSIWEREHYTIEAENETEALRKCISLDADPDNVEYLDDTVEYMLPVENNDNPTMEVFNSATDEVILSNNPISYDR